MALAVCRLKSMDKFNILVLHCLGSPRNAPRFLVNHVFALINNFPQHNYLYHDATLPLPEYVKQVDFHAILLDVTFLQARWVSPEYFQSRLDSYSFVAESGALKIAFPQDEYDCNELLDEWMCKWNVDIVFSVISSHHEVLYPMFHRRGVIKTGYTGYFDQELIGFKQIPFSDRVIDIGYRARKLPPYFGRLGQTKWTIGRDVDLFAKSHGLNTDIVLGTSGELVGKTWLTFISQCKFTLGANSGSSLLDPVGLIQKRVKAFLKHKLDAKFEEVEAACFPDLDGQYEFTAISPRVIEAGILESCQILVEGHYSGIIEPWVHYIPIKSDASDFRQVLAAMTDHALVAQMTKKCREKILDTPDLRSSNNAARLLNLIVDAVNQRNIVSPYGAVDQVIRRYQNDMHLRYAWMFTYQRLRQAMKRGGERLPGFSQLLSTMRNM
jgi:hypothetical protein